MVSRNQNRLNQVAIIVELTSLLQRGIPRSSRLVTSPALALFQGSSSRSNRLVWVSANALFQGLMSRGNRTMEDLRIQGARRVLKGSRAGAMRTVATDVAVVHGV